MTFLRMIPGPGQFAHDTLRTCAERGVFEASGRDPILVIEYELDLCVVVPSRIMRDVFVLEHSAYITGRPASL
jgi:hypothetical protein